MVDDDAFLGRTSNDLDFATNATPEQTEKLLRGWSDAVWDVGRAFGTIGATTRELTYRIRATTAGRFVVPPAYAESMYDPAAQARAAAAQIVVEAR